MGVTELLDSLPVAARHVAGEVRDSVYVQTRGRVDITRPRYVYGILNERCNLRCQGCHYWRLPVYKDELDAETWCRILADVKEFLGPYHINFSGGEPLIKHGVFEILEYCRDHGIKAGLTTNGMIVKDRHAERLVDARLFNLNVSLDGAVPETHDLVRGVEGSYRAVRRTIELMQSYAERVGRRQPIVLKPTINRLNFREMPALVRLAEEWGTSGALFQPIAAWGPDEVEDLWIRDFDALAETIEEVLELKRAGHAVLNSDEHLRDFLRHFRGEKPDRSGDDVRCWVGLQTLIIQSTGAAHNCDIWEPIGDLKTQSLREIWTADATRRTRWESTRCERGCTSNCQVKRPLGQKVQAVWRLLR